MASKRKQQLEGGDPKAYMCERAPSNLTPIQDGPTQLRVGMEGRALELAWRRKRRRKLVLKPRLMGNLYILLMEPLGDPGAKSRTSFYHLGNY